MSFEGLKSISLFRNMSDDIFQIVAPLVGEENFKAGQVIFKEGSSADRLFIIKNGEVDIRKVIAKEDGRYKLIAVLDKGEFFGEMAIFLDQPRSAEAVAKTDATLLTISKKDFSDLFNSSPAAAFKIMEFFTSVIMDRLRNTTNELVTIYETGRLVSAARSVSELSDIVMEKAFGAIEPEAGLFIIWNTFNREFEVYGQKGFDLGIGADLPESDPLVKWLIENGEPFLSFDLKNDNRISISEESIYSGSSMLASPFFSHDRLSGFIILLNRTRQNAFSYEHMILLSAISGYVSVAFDNLQYMQEAIDRSRLSRAKATIQ